MSELGEQLKRAREEKNISLDEIQAVTKIQKRYLQAIENGDFEKLPGSFYTKAFIKSYAEEVGLNYERLMRTYKHELPKTSEQSESLPPRRTRTTVISPARSKLLSALPGLFVFFVVIGILAIIWMLNINSSDGTRVDDMDENDQNVVVEQNERAISDENNKIEPIHESEEEHEKHDDEMIDNNSRQYEAEKLGILEKISVKGDTTNFRLSKTDEFQLDFTFSGDSWLKIQGSNGKLYVNEGFSNGQEVTFNFQDEENVRIRIGSTPHIKMFVNGEEVQLEPQPVAQTVKIEFQKQSSY